MLRVLLEHRQALDFLSESTDDCGFCLSLLGLPVPFLSPRPGRKTFESSLRALHLACDIVRLSLHLWARGVRACLIPPKQLGDDVEFLSSLPEVYSESSEDTITLWRGSGGPLNALFHLELILQANKGRVE